MRCWRWEPVRTTLSRKGGLVWEKIPYDQSFGKRPTELHPFASDQPERRYVSPKMTINLLFTYDLPIQNASFPLYLTSNVTSFTPLANKAGYRCGSRNQTKACKRYKRSQTSINRHKIGHLVHLLLCRVSVFSRCMLLTAENPR